MYRGILILISVFASAKTDACSAEAKKELVYFLGPNPLKHGFKNQLKILRVFPDNNVQIRLGDNKLGKHAEALLEIWQKNKSGIIYGFVEVPRIKDYENVLLELETAHPLDCVEMNIDTNISYNTARAVSPSNWRYNYTFVIRWGLHTTKLDNFCTAYLRVTTEPPSNNSTANISAYPRGTEKVEDTHFKTMLNEMLDEMFTFKPLDLLPLGFTLWIFVYGYFNNNARQEDVSRTCHERVRNGA